MIKRTLTIIFISSIISTLILTFVSTGCNRRIDINGKVIEEFIKISNIGLYGKWQQFTFNSNYCQYSYNYIKRDVKIFRDDFKYYFTLQLERWPDEIGEVIEATVTYVNSNNIKSVKTCFLTLVQANEEYLWLWDFRDNFGTIIPIPTTLIPAL